MVREYYLSIFTQLHESARPDQPEGYMPAAMQVQCMSTYMHTQMICVRTGKRLFENQGTEVIAEFAKETVNAWWMCKGIISQEVVEELEIFVSLTQTDSTNDLTSECPPF